MRIRPRYSALMLLFILPMAAQQGAVVFHHFRHYPTGQYTTQQQGSVSGLPPSAPVTQTACTVPPTAAQVATSIRVANSAASLQNCTMRVLRDEEKVVEYEQTCHNGPSTQVIHHTMTAIDDKNFKTDTVSKTGALEMTAHTTVHYDGPCTPAQLAETTASKPTPQECAEIVDSQKEMADSARSCDEAPAGYRDTCKKNLQAANANLKQLLAACGK